ncbi:MEMO1 family protein [Methanomassiliicoccus luminyensis]|jgi:AmmeMemoRadiSam system protein B|uniref:MEMO1 family protein n=1 Tax=Methanomassiliicoccus luminyensis TaxID=1080712 RepID=UPI000373429C|nr:MEMO1 family protein [Methanomassiliicoccus luminyensis]
MRRPAVAGKFYAGGERAVRAEIEKAFLSPLGPGEIPELNKNGPRSIVGAVAPHAGYVYSGPVAAHTYGALARDGFPETFVIMGPNHHAMGAPVAMSTEDFSTPLGVVKIDEDIAGRMGRLVVDDPSAHRYEHSIEVQLPFIQYFSDKAKIVPISMAAQDYETAVEVAEELRRACQGKDVVFIASTDFSHYVPAQEAERQDHAVIDKILAADPEGVYDTVVRRDVSMCGYGPVMTMMLASGGKKAELLKYGSSGDVTPMDEVVGYVSMVVRS